MRLWRWQLVDRAAAGRTMADVAARQDRLMIVVRDSLLARRLFRWLSPTHYFRRVYEAPPCILQLHCTTPGAVQAVTRCVVRRALGQHLDTQESVHPVLPEAGFNYGPPNRERAFWEYLSAISDTAIDLLATDARDARTRAVHVQYHVRARGPGASRAALESDFRARSASYRALVATGRADAFWQSFGATGASGPWDHWYYHLVLGDDMDPGYQGGRLLTEAECRARFNV